MRGGGTLDELPFPVERASQAREYRQSQAHKQQLYSLSGRAKNPSS